MNDINIDLGNLLGTLTAFQDLGTGLRAARSEIRGTLNDMNEIPKAVGDLEKDVHQIGTSIANALGQAARSSELDFRNMAETILADLARLAAESVFAPSGGAPGPTQNVNLNMTLGAGSDANSVIGAAGSIATALASAVSRGGRFL